MRYKVWFKDRKMNVGDYPVQVQKENIYELCDWINNYAVRWKFEVKGADIVDLFNNRLGIVHFIPTELDNQIFLTTPEERLIAYYEFTEVGV